MPHGGIDASFRCFHESLDRLLDVLRNRKTPRYRFLDHIDRIFYINLEHRTDRRENALKQLRMIDPDLSKVERFSGIEYHNDELSKRDQNTVGCSKSHIAVAQIARERGYNNVLVLEDDFNIKVTLEELDRHICAFFDRIKTFHFLLLGTGANLKTNRHDDILNKVLVSWNMTAYIMSSSVFPRWIDHANACTARLIKTKVRTRNVIDEAWYIFFGPHGQSYTFDGNGRRFVTQIAGFSDIDQYYVECEK